MAERVGFEPTVRCRITGFQDQLLKPLGHLSIPCHCIKLQSSLSMKNTDTKTPAGA